MNKQQADTVGFIWTEFSDDFQALFATRAFIQPRTRHFDHREEIVGDIIDPPVQYDGAL